MRELKEADRLANRYLLIRRIGSGGMSDVWQARDLRADTIVSLKFLKPELANKPAYRELFHNEWRVGSRLMHAHIGRVFEYHDESDGPFYSLQYIGGPDFGILANESVQNALPPFGLLADALRYAHGKGVVHRDIKAANVLLDERGVPHLIDFGVAATVGTSNAVGGGSPVGESPEQRRGDPPQPADDIYALGVLLHEVLTGGPPTDGIPNEPLQRADGAGIALPLQNLVAQMLSSDPTRRPSADEFKARLEAAGFSARPAKLALASSATTEADIPGDAEIESIQPIRHQPQQTSARIPSKSESRGVRPAVVLGGLGVMILLFVGVIFVLPNAVDDSPERAPVMGPEGADEGGQTDSETLDDIEAPARIGGDEALFGENQGVTSAEDAVRIKVETDTALGDLLSQLERLKYRGIERWGGQPYLDVLDVYAEGDQAYLNKNYETAGDHYRTATAMLEPFFDRIDAEFEKALGAAKIAFEANDFIEAIRLFDLAVAITPGQPEAEAGLKRALNLEAILSLMDQGSQFEDELELEAAKLAYEKALELDSKWQPAEDALVRVRKDIKQRSFESRMSEGLEALAGADFATARAAFNAAKTINPGSREPVDGLLQVDQELRLASIRTMEDEAQAQEANEQWESAVTTYQAILEVDSDLQFAQEGLARSNGRARIHRLLNDLIADPDALSDPVTMQRATKMVLDVSRMNDVGPRLDDQKKELSMLLKRAATPLPVRMISDNETEVSVYKVGKLGRFMAQDLSLRPGNYVAVGIRPGFRDVRLEFRVAPEIEPKPIVVQCEEPI